MSPPGQGRDRDASGRPRNARPRDALGRPLPYGAPGADADADAELARLEVADPRTLLAGAQRLLDEGRPFQAHELLEAAWKRAPGPERSLWRALAQLAVGLTHLLRGNVSGANALLNRGAQALEQLAAGEVGVPYGIDAAALAASARRIAGGKEWERLRLTR